MTTVQIKSVLTTQVHAGAQTTNYANSTSMTLRGGGTPVLGYIYFTRPFPLGATIISAKLKFYSGPAYGSATRTIYARRLNQTVSMSKVTYKTRPTALMSGEKSSAKSGALAANTLWEVDIKSDMQAVADGTKWYGYQLRSTDTAGIVFGSVKNANTKIRPWVEITWSDAPDIPERLSPAGSRVVSTPTPILRFDYSDVSGDTTLAKAHVQVNTTSSFTSPAYNSGEVAVDEPQFDLTGKFSCTAGTTYYWRVRVQDGAGLWSGWSAPASFVYRALPTLSIQNPAAEPNNFVEEPTPPIIWNVTGGTQTAYQLGLYSDSNGDLDGFQPKLEWSKGKTAGATDSFTVPAGFIKNINGQYRVDVRIYDAYDREAVPNGLPYAQASRTFTYQFSALTTGVTSLTATSVGTYPGIQLQWNRATAPDGFSVVRDGLVVFTTADPDALWVSGTTYRWTDRKPVKGRTHTYTVQAIVNGKASSSNPTATSSWDTYGTWLTDIDGSNPVAIFNDTNRVMTYSEQSTAHEILGSTQKVLITQALGGYDITIEGELHSDLIPGVTSSTFKTRYLNLKANPGQKLLLFVQNGTYEIVAQNMNVQRKPVPLEIYSVAFTAYQQASSMEFKPNV